MAAEPFDASPFVPACREFDQALEAAGVDRRAVYVTNAVEHFRFQERGKRRIHQKPDARQIKACRPWLLGELERLRPEVLVLLGATAAQSLLGSTFRLMAERGQPLGPTAGRRSR